MKKIFAIAWKDTLLRFSSPSEWLFFLILPIVFTLVLAGGTGAQTDPRVRLVVVDQAQSPLSRELIAELEKSGTVRPDLMALADGEAALRNRATAALLVIPAGFSSENLQAGPVDLELRQLPNNMNALVASRAVQAVTGRISASVDIARASAGAAETIRPFASTADRQAYFDAAVLAAREEMSAAPQRVASAEAETPDAIEYDPRANSSAGQLITWVFIPLIGLSGSFAYERQKGTLRRLLTTPTGKATFLVGSITGQVLVALVQMTLLVVFGITVMKLNWGKDLAALALILTASALAAAALGTALGTFVKSEGQASGLSMMLGMVMALLGGCWYPIELFPEFVRSAVKVLPTSWAMQGMLDLVLRGSGLVEILPEAAVLLGFSALFLFVGVRRFRYE